MVTDYLQELNDYKYDHPLLAEPFPLLLASWWDCTNIILNNQGQGFFPSQQQKKTSKFFFKSFWEEVLNLREVFQKNKWKFKMKFSIKRRIPPPPSLMDIIFINFFTSLFFFFNWILHMGEISQGVQSLNLMSHFYSPLRPFFGDLDLCYVKNWNSFWKYMSGEVWTCLSLDHHFIGGLFQGPYILPSLTTASKRVLIAPKASAEGACILSKMGY